jgi:hypothetical protein
MALDRFLGTVIIETLLGWFGKKSATLWLATLFAVLLTLNFFTNSIFLVPAEGSAPYVVNVVAPDLSLERSWEVETTTEGEIFHFNNWQAATVSINMGMSACFDEIERNLYPSATLRLRVPDDFMHRFTLLRLIPGMGIWNKLETGNDIELRITVNGVPELILPNPMRSVLVLGDIDVKIDCRLKQIVNQLEDRLRAHLESGQISAVMQARWISAWSNPVVANGLLLQAQDQVQVEVFEDETVIFNQTVSTASCVDGVCDIFMEVH